MAERYKRNAITLLWTIENIRQWKRDVFFLTSPKFRPRSLGRTELNIIINEKNGHVTLDLTHSNDPLRFSIDTELTLFGDRDPPMSDAERNSKSFEERYFVSSQEVFETRTSTFIPDGNLTVRCRVWKAEEEFTNCECICVRSKFEEVELSFIWPIPGFSRLALNEEVTSPFSLNFPPGTSEFQLKFSLRGDSIEDAKGNLELSAISMSGFSEVTLKASVLTHGEKALNCVEGKSYYAEDKYHYPFKEEELKPINLSQLLSRTDLLTQTPNPLSNDVLNVYLVFSFLSAFPNLSTDKKYYYGPSNLRKEPGMRIETLSDENSSSGDTLAILGEDLLELYQSQSMTDFELRSDDASFLAHKSVLSARSPVFKAMFSSNMKESESKSLNVPDLDGHTLNRMLFFLYGGTAVPMGWEDALQLFYAADKYQVQSLKRVCRSLFKSYIRFGNACDIVSLADRHNDMELKSFVQSFILSHFDETVSSPEWAEFLKNEPELAGNTMHQIYLEKLKSRKG